MSFSAPPSLKSQPQHPYPPQREAEPLRGRFSCACGAAPRKRGEGAWRRRAARTGPNGNHGKAERGAGLQRQPHGLGRCEEIRGASRNFVREGECHDAQARQKVAPRHAPPAPHSNQPLRIIGGVSAVSEDQGCAWLRCRRPKRRGAALLTRPPLRGLGEVSGRRASRTTPPLRGGFDPPAARRTKGYA